ncbi:MAG: hypothetical protein KDC12_07800 [Flavobacteriales bacterium]|nr:hypothetical protein [Flavobacteriales bacterium]
MKTLVSIKMLLLLCTCWVASTQVNAQCSVPANADGLPNLPLICPSGLEGDFILPFQNGIATFHLTILPPADPILLPGILGGEDALFTSDIFVHYEVSGDYPTLAGDLIIPGCETFGVTEPCPPRANIDHAPVDPAIPIQLVEMNLHGLEVVFPIPGIFDQVRIVNDFPENPGQANVQNNGGDFSIDSFFDIFYRIEFQGTPTGPTQGESGIASGQGTLATPGTDCDDGDPCTDDIVDPFTGECTHVPVWEPYLTDIPPAPGPCLEYLGVIFTSLGTNYLPGSTLPEGFEAPAGGQVIEYQFTGECALNVKYFYGPKDCDDGDPCTDDYCDPETGACVHVPIWEEYIANPPAAPGPCLEYLGVIISVMGGNYVAASTLPEGYQVPNGGEVIEFQFTGQCSLNVKYFYGPKDCDDGDPCTDDYCDPETGECVHVKIWDEFIENPPPPSGPCMEYLGVIITVMGGNYIGDSTLPEDFELPEGGQVIEHQFTGFCSMNVKYFFGPKDCDDGDPCTDDFCNPETGECVHVPIWQEFLNAPELNNLCLEYQGVIFTSLGTTYLPGSTLPEDYQPSDDAHVIEYQFTGPCALNVKYFYEPKDCDDGNPCTIDECDPLTGQCIHTWIGDDPNSCDDENACTYDWYDPESCSCQHDEIDCDDGNPCTFDDCYPEIGCVHIPITQLPNYCDDGLDCTTDSWNPVTCECEHVINCDDGDPCTIDSCDPLTGQCQYVPKDCYDGDPCTVDYCDANGICQHDPHYLDLLVPPASPGPCWTYLGAVVFQNGSYSAGLSTLANGAQGNPDNSVSYIGGSNSDLTEGLCTIEVWHVFGPKNCSDGDPCTIDSCDGATGNCIHTQINCDDGDPCTIDSCVNGTCVHTPMNCDDGNPCTIDICVNGQCVHIPINCDDGDPCTIDSCVNGTCVHTPINCDDGDPCTIDTCVNGQCIHTPIVCDDGDPCTTDTCVNGTCIHTPKDCDDGDPCTVDTCVNGVCIHTPMDCDDGDPCTVDTCVNGQCIHTPMDCHDGNPCTVDACVNGQCTHTPLDCDDGDPCTIDICDNGTCLHILQNCDDGNPCTIDYCDSVTGICVHDWLFDDPNSCDDGDPCTIDYYDPDLCQCVHDPIVCDDGDPCTEDYCVDGICFSIPRDCDDGAACTYDYCDGDTGECKHVCIQDACPEDINNDGTIDTADLLLLLGAYGSDCD